MVTVVTTDAPHCVVVVCVDGDERRYFATVHDLARLAGRDVVVAAPTSSMLATFAELGVESMIAPSAARRHRRGVVTAARAHLRGRRRGARTPGRDLRGLSACLAADLRNASVSFLSNDAGPLSFPSNHPTPAVPPGFDHRSLTERFRSLPPTTAPFPAPFAAGGAVMLSDVALSAVGGLATPPAGVSIDACIADFSIRGRERGFIDLCDADTFVFRPPVPGHEYRTAWMTEGDRGWLLRRHPQLVPAFEREATEAEAPIPLATRLGRTKAFGLRVLIDDATLGPFETGAQITTLAIIDALAKLDDVQEVGVALGGHMPAYSRAVLGQPKIRPSLRAGGYAAFADFDVLHRTAQPDKDFDVDAARGPAARVVISILDLIAYRAGSYHATTDDWLRTGRCFVTRRAVPTASRRSRKTSPRCSTRSASPWSTTAVFPVLYGTEHIGGHEDASFPQELAAKGRLAEQFVVCLGTDYAHKNRDLAVAVHRELAERGRRIMLVLAGPSVPYGGSRNSERQHFRDDGDVVFLPNVSSRERNWLFRHAAVVLYPTSAEGFGLVPFEAARFGSPTVTVGFGPLLETSGGPSCRSRRHGTPASSPIAWSDSSTTPCCGGSR